MKEIVIDGKNHLSIEDVHKLLAKEMDFGTFYGENFSALWDLLTTEVERPLKVKLLNAKLLKESLGEKYDRLVTVFEKVERYDKEMGLNEKFIFTTIQ